jgi:superfamily I DNA/RNA helicase
VWKVIEAFRAALAGRVLWSDVHRLAREHLAKEGAPYRAAVVDEAQDMSGEQLRLLRALVAPGPDDLFLVGDAHQRIWRDAIPFSSCGIKIVGRSTKLALNYRTTEAIRRFAVKAVAALAVDDMDEGDDSKEGYVSLRAGTAPVMRGFTSEDEELAFVVNEVRRHVEAGTPPQTICLLTRESRTRVAVARALEQACITVCRLDAKDADEGDGVRLSSMHRAKGLEFMHVLLVGAGADLLPPKGLLDGLDAEQRALVERQERALLYVAGTRSRESLTITWVGAPSPLLGEVHSS